MSLAHSPRQGVDTNSSSNRRKAPDTTEEIDIVQTLHKKHKPGPFSDQAMPTPSPTNLNDLAALILGLK
ncbi:unnamed protein product [Allacma fusca]|uniref:Uncharacterized protein n=1 Tax=Allacma fusca TaxID=39272 RepID=A0A8J2NX72_9HEXA|nr:unnamed protein product [Allacma fusca]